MNSRQKEQDELDRDCELAALRAEVLALKEFLFDLNQRGGLGQEVHKLIRALLSINDAGASIAAERARKAYNRTANE